MPDNQAGFRALGAQLAASDNAAVGQMFGMPILKIGSKAFAGLHDEGLVFKLAGDSHAGALDLSGAHLFDPGMGRPMKEWVVVPAAHSAEWPRLGKAALDYVAAGARKQ